LSANATIFSSTRENSASSSASNSFCAACEEAVKNSKAPVAYARGSERMSDVQTVLPNRDREGVGMGLQLTKGDENLGEERYPR
jgi:acetyl-CoA acetyltransferase